MVLSVSVMLSWCSDARLVRPLIHGLQNYLSSPAFYSKNILFAGKNVYVAFPANPSLPPGDNLKKAVCQIAIGLTHSLSCCIFGFRGRGLNDPLAAPVYFIFSSIILIFSSMAARSSLMCWMRRSISRTIDSPDLLFEVRKPRLFS